MTADTAAEENEDIDRLKEEISAWTGIDLEHRQRSDLPERLYKFLKLLLSLDPNERPGTEEILQSIKAGSTLHDQGQARSASSPPPGEIEQNPGGSANMVSSSVDTRRRQSAFGRPSAVETKSLHNENRRPSSPRMLSSGSQSHAKTDAVMRRSSVDVGIAKQDAVSRRLLTAPKRRRAIIVEYLEQPSVQLCSKLLQFGFKAWSCLKPCSPTAARGWIVYPLLGMAALDLARFDKSQVMSVVLWMLHLCALSAARYWDYLCEVPGGG